MALIPEIRAAIDPLDITYEIIVIDDGSTDDTGDALRRLLDQHADVLRVIAMTHTPPGRGHGQSAAFHAGIRASRGGLLAFMDADLQNDPADLPAMLEAMRARDVDVVQGDRSANRRDTMMRRAGSFVGRVVRRAMLGDTIRDTGCSLRIMRREVALRLPLEYRGMHRFIPVTARDLGYTVIEIPVHHRPRVAGHAKYGVWSRALPGFIDCLAVRWMRRRRRPVSYHSRETTVPADRIEALSSEG